MGNKTTLTVKEIAHDGIDGVQEIEVVVSDFNATNELLGKLGFTPKSYQENRRASFTLDGVELEIDEWPMIPPYLEIEGPSPDEVYRVAALLGYDKDQLTSENTTKVYARHTAPGRSGSRSGGCACHLPVESDDPNGSLDQLIFPVGFAADWAWLVGHLTGRGAAPGLGAPFLTAPSGPLGRSANGASGGTACGGNRELTGAHLRGGTGRVVGLACRVVGCQAVGVMTDADRSRTPQEARARLRPGVSVRETPAGHDYAPGLGWFKVWQRGQRVGPPPAGLSPDALERRRFAERLADTFAYPDVYAARYGHGGDLVGASSAFVPVEASPLAQRVIANAPTVTEQVMTTPGETRVYCDGYGVVVLVHGPDWSLVFEVSSLDVVVRVCGDEWGDTALAVDEDPDPQVQSALLTMAYDVLFQLQRLSVGGDLFTEPGAPNAPHSR